MVKRIVNKMLSLIFSLFKLLPQKKIIIFESQPLYSDNTKLIFDSIIEDPFFIEYEKYWIVTDGNNEKNRVKFNLIKFDNRTLLRRISSEVKINYNLSRCTYYIFSHQNYSKIRPKKSQCFFNLTHGISLKNTIGLYPNSKFSSYISVLSPFTKKIRIKSFKGGKSKMLITGFPRNDLLFENHGIKTEVLGLSETATLLIWLPTFRRQKNTGRNDSGTKDDNDLPIFKSNTELEILNKLLIACDSYLIIKPHPSQNLQKFNVSNYKNIMVLSNDDIQKQELHLYNYLAESDGLITDYSSVYIDYLLTNKPICFTVDDMENYSMNKGFIVDNPKDYMPGNKISTPNEFYSFVKDINEYGDLYSKERLKMKRIMHEHTNAGSRERIMDILKEAIE